MPYDSGTLKNETTLPTEFKISFLKKTAKNRNFIPSDISLDEISEIVDLEKLCYSNKERYDFHTVHFFLSQPGMVSIRIWDTTTKILAGFHLFNSTTAELITLDIHPQYRRRKLGRHLVEMSSNYLKKTGHKNVRCEIAVDNAPSLNLHYALGFKPIKTLHNYYGKRRDAFLLIASLT